MVAHKDPSAVQNDLHRLLLTAVPADARGEKTIVNLARLMEVSRSSIWKWVTKQSLPPHRAAQLVDLSEGRITLADCSRFVYNL